MDKNFKFCTQSVSAIGLMFFLQIPPQEALIFRSKFVFCSKF